MLPLKQYTLEDYYKFYRLITPLIDKATEENPDLAMRGAIRLSHDQLREALQVAFPEESNAVPSIFRSFVELMIKEMHCEEIVPCEERTGVYWYNVEPYLNMRKLNPEVHQAIRIIQEKAVGQK